MDTTKFHYYVSIKRLQSTAIVIHLCDYERTMFLIKDYVNNITLYDLFEVKKK
jgi:hypothetical protein